MAAVGAVAVAIAAAASGIGCARPVVEGGAPPPVHPGCAGLEGGTVLAQADAELLDGRYETALTLYRDLIRRFPACPLPHVRVGDAHRLAGSAAAALAAYDRALDIAPCYAPARTGKAMLAAPIAGGAGSRIDYARSEVDAALACDAADAEAHSLAWRLMLRAGDVEGARVAIRRMARDAWFPEAALDYGRNLLRTARGVSVIFASSDLEADLAIAAGGGNPTDHGALVVDLTLLDHPWYARHLQDLGLPLGLDEGTDDPIQPYWSRADKRTLTVAEQILRRVIDAVSNRSLKGGIAFSASTTHPFVYGLADRLSLVGLLTTLDDEAVEVDPDAVRANLRRYRLDSLEDARRAFGAHARPSQAAGLDRLLSNYPSVALRGAGAAYRRGDRAAGDQLLAAAERVALTLEKWDVFGDPITRLRNEFGGPPASGQRIP
jgi:hypothetical protein